MGLIAVLAGSKLLEPLPRGAPLCLERAGQSLRLVRAGESQQRCLRDLLLRSLARDGVDIAHRGLHRGVIRAFVQKALDRCALPLTGKRVGECPPAQPDTAPPEAAQ